MKAEGKIQVLDAKNKTIIPGLFDCHTHLIHFNRQWTHEKYVPQEITKGILLGVYNAIRCIQAGVLTVRDAGCGHVGIFQFRDMINSGKILGPRILASGLPISMTGGHGWNSSYEIDGTDEMRKAVRDQLRWGADCIKFMATGGSATPYEEIDQYQLNVDELTAGVEEAKKKDKRTLAHVGSSQGALNCVKAGVDSLDHGCILNNNALNAMKKANSFLTPTLVAYWRVAEYGESFGYDEWNIRKAKQILEYHKESFQKAHKLGIRIAHGTDCGGVKSPLGEPSLTELEMSVKYGMSPLEAIKSATYMSACNCGIEKLVGTLEKSKMADLVIVDGDPIENISNLRRVWKVVKEGKIVYEV